MTRSEMMIKRVRDAAHEERQTGEGTELQIAALALADEYEIVVRQALDAVAAVHELVKIGERNTRTEYS